MIETKKTPIPELSELAEGMPVEVWDQYGDYEGEVLVAYNEGGHNHTVIPIEQLCWWIIVNGLSSTRTPSKF